MACVQFPRKLFDGNAIALKAYEQVVHQIGSLITNMVVISVFTRKRYFGRFLGHFLEHFVLRTLQKTRRIAFVR